MQPGKSVAAGWLVGQRVDLQRRADPRVAEDRLRVTDWHFQILEKRPDRVPQVMNLDQPDLVGVADAAKGADQVARLDRTACPGREHESGLWPSRAHVGPVGGLLGSLELERLAGEVYRSLIAGVMAW